MLLAQNISEIVAIVAIALISLIFVVYLIILKKTGWIGGQSNFYRCTNQECKKIFKKPIELKDLSQTPPRVYPACPECGVDLNTFFGSSNEKVPKISKQNIIHEKKPEVRSVETPNQNQQQFSILRERVKEAKPSRDSKKTKTVDVPGCEYSFGYLAGRNIKQEGIPAICLSCPRTLECLIHSC